MERTPLVSRSRTDATGAFCESIVGAAKLLVWQECDHVLKLLNCLILSLGRCLSSLDCPM
jgi:hypothetical protein